MQNWLKDQGLTLVIWVFFGGMLYQKIDSLSTVVEGRNGMQLEIAHSVKEVEALHKNLSRVEAEMHKTNERMESTLSELLPQERQLLLMTTTNQERIAHIKDMK